MEEVNEVNIVCGKRNKIKNNSFNIDKEWQIKYLEKDDEVRITML